MEFLGWPTFLLDLFVNADDFEHFWPIIWDHTMLPKIKHFGSRNCSGTLLTKPLLKFAMETRLLGALASPKLSLNRTVYLLSTWFKILCLIFSEYHIILDDLICLLSLLKSCLWTHVKRDGNIVTDKLARVMPNGIGLGSNVYLPSPKCQVMH